MKHWVSHFHKAMTNSVKLRQKLLHYRRREIADFCRPMEIVIVVGVSNALLSPASTSWQQCWPKVTSLSQETMANLLILRVNQSTWTERSWFGLALSAYFKKWRKQMLRCETPTASIEPPAKRLLVIDSDSDTSSSNSSVDSDVLLQFQDLSNELPVVLECWALCVCVRACMRACMRACVHACVRACVYAVHLSGRITLWFSRVSCCNILNLDAQPCLV